MPRFQSIRKFFCFGDSTRKQLANHRSTRLAFEHLEQRQLLSVTPCAAGSESAYFAMNAPDMMEAVMANPELQPQAGEALSEETPSTIVTTTDDVVNPNDGLISFREAVELYSAAGDTITFAEGNKTLTVDRAVAVNKNLTIGDGFILSTTDPANNLFTAENSTENITFGNVTIQNGNVNMGEGGITIVASKMLMLGNTASGSTSTWRLTSGTFANNGAVIVAKSWDCNAANFGSVAYWGTTDQTVLAGTYNDLVLSGSGNMNANGSVTVDRKLTVGSGTTFDVAGDLAVGSAAHESDVNITNNGSIALSGDFNYTGADASFGNFTYKANDGEIAAGGYGNLTITGDCTRTLVGAVTVNNTLTLAGASDAIVTLEGDHKTLSCGSITASYATINNVNFSTAQTVSGWDVNTNTVTGSGNTNLLIDLGGTFSAAVTNTLVYGQTLKDDAEIGITYSLRGQNATLTGSTTNDTIYDAGEQTANVAVSAAGYTFSENTTFTASSLSFTVNPKPVTITGVAAQDKPYDGNTDAVIDCSNAAVSGTIGTETLTINTANASGAFADANVGKNKTVTVSGLTLGDGENGGLASNYTFEDPAGTSVASIFEAPSTVVTTADDVVDKFDDKISLREAISYAGTGTLGSVITFSDTVDWAKTPIELALGELTIDKALTIQGSADKPVTIDAKEASRIFYIGDGVVTPVLEVKLTGLHLLNGKSSTDGGAIYNNNELLTLSHITFTGNHAAFGGAIYNHEYGTLMILDSVFTSNGATAGGAIGSLGHLSLAGTSLTGNSSINDGGAVYSVGVLVVNDSSFVANQAENGGAIALDTVVDSGVIPVSIDNSYFAMNTASRYGGAIYSVSQVTGTTLDIAVVNSVIDSNSGGGICNNGANVKTTIVNSTVALNSGTQIINWNGKLYLINDVVVNQTGTTDSAIDNIGNECHFYGVVTSGSTGGSTFWKYTADVTAEDVFVSADPDQIDLTLKTGGPAATNGTLAGNIQVLDPDMGNGNFYYLRDGNWTMAGDDSRTYAFDPTNADGNYGLGSNGEIGAIKNVYDTALNKDEWGIPVSRTLTTDFFSVGAYAINQELETQSTVVTLVEDTTNPYDNQISLREAIRYAETLGTPVTFAVADGSTLVVNGELNLAQDTVIDGGTKNLTISGGFQSGVFVNHGTSTLRNLKILGGKDSTEIGQGISNYGDLTLENVQVSLCGDAATTVNGGGIGNNLGAVLTMVGCTVSGNTAQNGAGIHNLGEVHIQDTVFSSNLALTDGGAFYGNGGTQTFDGVSIYGNQAHENGGGIFIGDAGAFEMKNSLVFGNGAFSGTGSNGNGGGLFLTGGGTVTQSTIAGNFANENGGGIYTDSTEKLIVRNSLVSENKAGGGSAHDIFNQQAATDMFFSLLSRQSEAGSSTILDENCITQLYAQFGKIPDANPSNIGMDFADADWNLQLNPAAPTDTDRTVAMIDAGDNSQVADGAVDFYGNARVANGTVDMGAIEVPKVTLSAGTADSTTLTIAVNSSVQNPSTLVLKQRVQGETDWSDSVFSLENNVITVTGLTSKTAYEFQLTETKTAPVSPTVYPEMNAVSNILSVTTAAPHVYQNGYYITFEMGEKAVEGESYRFQFRFASTNFWLTLNTRTDSEGTVTASLNRYCFLNGYPYEYRFIDSSGSAIQSGVLTTRTLKTPGLTLTGESTTTMKMVLSNTDENATDYYVSCSFYQNFKWSVREGTISELLASGDLTQNSDGSYTFHDLPAGSLVQVKLQAQGGFDAKSDTLYLESYATIRNLWLPQPRKLTAPVFQVKATGPKTAEITISKIDSDADEIHCQYREFAGGKWSDWTDTPVAIDARTVTLTDLTPSALLQVRLQVSSTDTNSFLDSAAPILNCFLPAIPTLTTPIYGFNYLTNRTTVFLSDQRSETFEAKIQVSSTDVSKTTVLSKTELSNMTNTSWLGVIDADAEPNSLLLVSLQLRALPPTGELLNASNSFNTYFFVKVTPQT